MIGLVRIGLRTALLTNNDGMPELYDFKVENRKISVKLISLKMNTLTFETLKVLNV